MRDIEELAAEQRHVDRAYERLALRQGAAERMEIVGGESAGEILERDELAAIRARRVASLRIGDLPLCFGRIDTGEGDAWHVGRIGVCDEAGDQLVVDWRAPIAAAFYRATAREPLGVVRRRHLRCSAATVLGLDDEELGVVPAGEGLVLVGEAALLRAVQRRRTGRMADIVATIQSEQDLIIRAPLADPLVVQGGPGTGKTAVALHRLAYLLYTHRELFEAKGVLLIGPSTTFLRYIERVLPSLGEQGATLATMATLAGYAAAAPPEAAAVTQLKGDARMAALMRRAVQSRQRPLAKSVEIPFGAYRLRFGARASEAIVGRARSHAGTHNERRSMVERDVFAHLHRVYAAAVERAQRVGQRAGSAKPLDEFTADIQATAETQRLLARLWPVLTPERLLTNLFGHEALLREAAEGLLTEAERALLLRHAAVDDGLWSAADVALLDEAAVHLGPVPTVQRSKAQSEDLDWMADRVIEGVAADANISLSSTMAAEIRERILREEVATDHESHRAQRRRVSSAYAHVVVDEAQDLSPMEWRMVSRRCPSGSMTLVGDLGQASGAWQLGWDAVLDLAAPSRPGVVIELTTNYRTPSEVMELAARILRVAAPHLRPPASVRSNGRPPLIQEVPAAEVEFHAVNALRAMGDRDASGTAVIIAVESRHDELRKLLDAAPATRRTGTEPLDDPVSLLTPTQAKGLEFDFVVTVEPAEIAPTPSALLALYVALTRTTDELVIVHAQPLPACLAVS